MSMGFTIITYCAAAFAALLACGVLFQRKRGIPHWSFAAGMLVLSAESCFVSLSSNIQLVLAALLPGPWLLFTFAYGRGSASEDLSRWRHLLQLAVVLPPFDCNLAIILFYPCPEGFQSNTPFDDAPMLDKPNVYILRLGRSDALAH